MHITSICGRLTGLGGNHSSSSAELCRGGMGHHGRSGKIRRLYPGRVRPNGHVRGAKTHFSAKSTYEEDESDLCGILDVYNNCRYCSEGSDDDCNPISVGHAPAIS